MIIITIITIIIIIIVAVVVVVVVFNLMMMMMMIIIFLIENVEANTKKKELSRGLSKLYFYYSSHIIEPQFLLT